MYRSMYGLLRQPSHWTISLIKFSLKLLTTFHSLTLDISDGWFWSVFAKFYYYYQVKKYAKNYSIHVYLFLLERWLCQYFCLFPINATSDSLAYYLLYYWVCVLVCLFVKDCVRLYVKECVCYRLTQFLFENISIGIISLLRISMTIQHFLTFKVCI